MKKNSLFLALTLFSVLGCVNFGFGQSNVNLPSGVQNILNQNFPKWKVVKNVCQTAASGDFNGDKKTDYIAVITYQNGGSLVGFVSNGNSFQQIVVQSLTANEAKTGVVQTARKGEEVSQDPFEDNSPKVRLKNDGFYWGECESDGAGVLIFKNNDFVSPFGGLGNNSGGNNNNNPISNNGGCSGKTYPITTAASKICFPNGDISFADELVDFQIGNPHSNDNQYGDDMTNPQEAIGIPNSRQKENKWNAVALGSGGVMTVKFTNNALIDVDGMDLYAFEVGSNVEPTKVEISKDGRNWIYIGELRGAVSGIDIAGKVRRGEEFYFVRLTDLRENNTRPIGADIDAIGAIGTVRKNSNQIPRTPSGMGGNNSSNNSGDGSIDIGKAIWDKIKENRDKNKKPKDNSSGNNNQDSNNSSGGCVFKETFTIPVGKNAYVKDYAISLGNGNYRVEFAQNLNRDKMFPGFSIGFFDNRKDPDGEHRTTFISGASWGRSVQGSHPSIAYWTHATPNQPEREYRAGEFATSDNFTNKKYTTLRISYFQGVGAENGATGKYEIRIIGPGCSSGSSSSSGNNNPPVSNPPNNNPPPTSQGSRTVKIFLYKEQNGDRTCATKLFSVNRKIFGSQSVLSETLDTLFTDETPSEGANYTAGLSLVSVSVTNGVANIVVTGSQNNPCASLFEEQVRKTAMQFPTVKSVNISFSEQEFYPQDELARGLEVFNGYATSLVKPNYPSSARNARIGGAVEVKITVDNKGKVTFAQAISGAFELHESAESAARASKFSSSAFNKTGILVFNFIP